MTTGPHLTEPMVRVCPACRADNTATAPTIYGCADWPIKVCAACRFVYMESVPDYSRLSDELAWEKTSAAETCRRKTHAPLRKSISDCLKAARRYGFKRDKLLRLTRRYIIAGPVLDVGCADGSVLARLDECYQPHGIEISAALAACAQARVAPQGGRVVHAPALQGFGDFADQTFSGILLSAFLEHEIDPARLLDEVFRTLRPGGQCIIKVPNFGSLNRRLMGAQWCGIRLPDHVNYFTPASLVQLCQSAGLQITRFAIRDRLPSSDNMWIVVGRARSNAG